MSDLIENESVKLTANWLNGMSITLVGAGIVVPLINQIFGNSPMPPENLALVIVGCVIMATILHLTGQKVLRGLHEPDAK